MSARTCPECSGALEHDRDETVCADCGLVVAEDRIDRGPEWRSFEDEERSRTGAPLTRSRHDRGLSTEIGYSNRLTGRKRRRVARMRKQHDRARISTKSERNQVYGFTEIRRIVGALELPESVQEGACALFESAQNEDLLRGRSLEGFAAAAVYAVCRAQSIARAVEEVLAPARADEGELRAAYDAMNRELGLPTGPVDPGEYLPRFADSLGLGADVERRARDLLSTAEDRGLVVGRNPCGVAAACLYTAAIEAGANVTQTDAAGVADVTPVTLRNTYQELRD
jgi:transcription initiation factor TFIIB